MAFIYALRDHLAKSGYSAYISPNKRFICFVDVNLTIGLANDYLEVNWVDDRVKWVDDDYVPIYHHVMLDLTDSQSLPHLERLINTIYPDLR